MSSLEETLLTAQKENNKLTMRLEEALGKDDTPAPPSLRAVEKENELLKKKLNRLSEEKKYLQKVCLISS